MIGFLLKYISEDSFKYTNILFFIIIFLCVFILWGIISFIIPKKGKCCLSIVFLFIFGIFIFNQYNVEVNRFDIDFGIEKPLKIVQLSDIHYNSSASFSIDKAIAKCNREKPNIVVLTGDYKSDVNQKDLSDDFFKKIRHIQCDNIYAVYGNHDRFQNKKLMKEKFHDSGVTILNDDYKKVDKNLYVLGVDYDGVYGKKIENNLRKLAKGSKIICLTHNPSAVLLKFYNTDYVKNRRILFLTGHTHGGQIVLPWKDKQEIAENKFYIDTLNGMTKIENNEVYINKGIGSAYIPFRLFAKPEIAVFTIK